MIALIDLVMVAMNSEVLRCSNHARESLFRSMGGLGSCCNVVEENTEVGGPCKDGVFDSCTLSTESTSLLNPMHRSATPPVEHVWWV